MSSFIKELANLSTAAIDVMSHFVDDLPAFLLVSGGQEDAGAGLGDLDWGGPMGVGEGGTGLGLLGRADQEGETSAWPHEGSSRGEDGFEALDGAQGYHVVARGESFGARVLYIDVRQCKSAGDFFEERGFLMIGLDQGEGDVRSPEFDGDAGESGAGAEVGDGGAVVGRGSLVVGQRGG